MGLNFGKRDRSSRRVRWADTLPKRTVHKLTAKALRQSR